MSPKDKKLTVLLTEDERQQLEAAADAAGFQTVSAYVRHVTIGGGKGVQFAAEIREDVKRILEILDRTKQENKTSAD